MDQDLDSPRNLLLAALPTDEYQRLLPHLELVSLPLRQVLSNPGEPIEFVCFPHQSIISLVTILEDGSTVEAGLVGKEGMFGVQAFLGGDSTPHQAIVQVAGEAMRMSAAQLKIEFQRGGKLQSLLLRYVQALFTQVSQGAACHRLHTVEERLARWLLMVSDRLEPDQLPLTQEFIAQMLGTRRAGVTVAAGMLQQAGLIRYRRGEITILDRQNLEAASCECYKVVSNEFERLLDTRG